MNAYVDRVREITIKEKESQIYKKGICNVPLWRLFRSVVIDNYLFLNYGFGKRNQRKIKISYSIALKSYFNSLYGFLKLFLSRKKFRIVVFAFQRLQKAGSLYTDKFTDPLTDFLGSENFLIFQRPLGGKHLIPRLNSEKVVHIEAVEYTAKIIGTILTPFIFFLYAQKILFTFKEAKNLFGVKNSFILSMSLSTSRFLASYILYRLLFKKLKTRKVFLVNREINLPVIRAAHKLGIESFELQHGITFSYTVLYSSQFNRYSDPNYFLSFGAFWNGKQFGIPKEKILNLGWGFRKSIELLVANNIVLQDNRILIISEPRVGASIIKNVLELANNYGNLFFDIRLHPQEKLDQNLYEQIYKTSNVKITENATESSISLMSYQFVMGVNSSVLFEAVSLDKKVGCFNYGGCHPFAFLKLKENPFFILNSLDDFADFVAHTDNHFNEEDNVFYSRFNTKLFNKLIDN